MSGINEEEFSNPFENFRDGPFRSPGGAGWDPFLTGVDYLGPMVDNPVEEGFIAPESVGPDQIAPGSTLADTTPPASPTGLTLSSAASTDVDGSTSLLLTATLVQPTDTDLFASYVQVTSRESSPGVPDWAYADTILIGAGETSASISGVPGGTLYYARAVAADQWGNRSPVTATVTHTTVADPDAPDMPTGFALSAGFRGFGATWTRSLATDLSYYELRYAPDDGTGNPDTSAWANIRTRANAIFVPNLMPDIMYWAQVRAVDRSGNVVTSESDPTAVIAEDNPEAGWTDTASVTPTLIGASDVAFNSVVTNLLAAGVISADALSAGSLRIGGTDGISGIFVESGGEVVGLWDADGLKIIDPSDASRYLLIDAGEIRFTTDDGATFPTAITPEGINASAIKFGSAPGGHNVVLNSSFELTGFVSAPFTFTFTDTTNWAAANRVTALANITEGTDLSMTTPGYV